VASVVCLTGVTALWVVSSEALERAAFGGGALVVAGVATVATVVAVVTVLAGPPTSGLVRWILALCIVLVAGGGVGVLALTAVFGGGDLLGLIGGFEGGAVVDLGAGVALTLAMVGMGVVATQVASRPAPTPDNQQGRTV
jgi:hypothetical protein